MICLPRMDTKKMDVIATCRTCLHFYCEQLWSVWSNFQLVFFDDLWFDYGKIMKDSFWKKIYQGHSKRFGELWDGSLGWSTIFQFSWNSQPWNNGVDPGTHLAFWRPHGGFFGTHFLKMFFFVFWLQCLNRLSQSGAVFCSAILVPFFEETTALNSDHNSCRFLGCAAMFGINLRWNNMRKFIWSSFHLATHRRASLMARWHWMWLKSLWPANFEDVFDLFLIYLRATSITKIAWVIMSLASVSQLIFMARYEQVPLKSGALGIQVRMKPGKQRGTKKGLKWHPEVRDGRTFAGGNRRNTPFQPLYPIAETPDGNAETRMSEGRISDPSVSEVRVPDPRMSQKSMLEDRVSAPRMSEGGTSAPRMSEARMSDGRMSDPRMSEARMSEARMSDPRMSEARMSDGRMSDPRMSEARMSEARMSDPRMSEARMSEARMSDPRMSEARMSDGRMSDPRMSEARMSDGRMSDPRMSEARMSEARMSDPRMSEARMSEARMSDPRMSEARMSDGRMSDPRMSEARMSEARMSDPRMSEARMSEARMSDPRMSEARMSDGRMSDPRMSEARMSEARMSDPRMSEARMSEARMSDPRMSEARMSDGRMSDPRMSEARMSDGRMSDPRMSEARMSEARMSDPRMSEARMSEARMSEARMSDPRMSEARMSDGRMSDSRMSEARMSDGRMSDPRMSEARMSEARMSDPRMSEARMSQGSMPRASQTRASDARASDVQFSPSVASMQLDVAEMEARNTVRSNPRYSNRMSASSARASVADRRSTARSSIAVKMQQDPGDATDSSLASINDHRESTERMSLGASLQAQSGSIYSPYVEDAPKRSLRGSQSMPCSMPMASDSEKTSDSQNSQIPSPMVAASDDGSRQGESLGELSQSRTSRSSVPRTSRTSQSRRMSSRASRLSKAKNESTGGTARAVCRFTHPEAVNFCGLEIVACKCQEAKNLAGRDRSALLVLLEQAGKSVEAARQMKGLLRANKICKDFYAFVLC